MLSGRDAVDGTVWLTEPQLKDGSGPTRVATDDPDPKFRPRHVGFTADLDEETTDGQ